MYTVLRKAFGFRFVRETVCCVVAAMCGFPLGVLQFVFIYHPLHDTYKVPTAVCLLILFTVYGSIVWMGDRYSEERTLSKYKGYIIFNLLIATNLILYSLPVLNPLPNDRILDLTKLKAFADDKFIGAEMMISLFDRVENTVGKGENAGYQHFLLFPQCFPNASSIRSLKVRDCVVRS